MTPALEVRGLQKSFGGVPALRHVSFSVSAGEVAALVGENGAGKSTIIKIVTGQIQPDEGEVLIGGVKLEHADPRAARAMGVGIVPQELAPYPDLTVYENLFVGRELRSRFGTLDRKAMISQAAVMLAVFDVDVDPRRRMNQLPIALTQIVEIAKATTFGARVMLLDEPTSAIPKHEVADLYAVVRKLREQGVALVYTTHRMEEVRELADKVIVLRDGQFVMESPIDEATDEGIVRAMIGRQMESLFPAITPGTGEVGLAVDGLQLKHGGPTVDLVVHRGEIVGLGGLVGAGRTEILEAIFGIRVATGGSVDVAGETVGRNSPAVAIKAGVALVPEDRKQAGLVLSRSVLDNGSLPHLGSYARAGWISGRRRRSAVDKATKSVSLASRGLDQLAGTLSGGNQQKVVLARWLTHDVNVLLLDEPTRGVDVGARGEIYSIIHDLASRGLAVLLVSSDMPELVGLSHRVLVMRNGAVTAELSREELDRDDVQETIFRLASGQLTTAGRSS